MLLKAPFAFIIIWTAISFVVSGATVTSMGVQLTADSGSQTSAIVTLSLWYTSTIYQCSINPSSAGQAYSCVPTVIGINCSFTETKMLIENAHIDGAIFADIFFETDAGDTYTVASFCISDSATIGAHNAGRGTATTCTVMGEAGHVFDEMALDNQMTENAPSKQVFYFDTASPNVPIDAAAWQDGTNVFAAGCVGRLPVTSIGVQLTADNPSAGTVATVTLSLWYASTIYQCSINPYSVSQTYTCVPTAIGRDCSFTETKMLIENAHTDGPIWADIFFETDAGDTYTVASFCISDTAIIGADYRANIGTTTTCTVQGGAGRVFIDLCIDIDNCAPSKQVVYFDTASPNVPIDAAAWQDGTNVFAAANGASCLNDFMDDLPFGTCLAAERVVSLWYDGSSFDALTQTWTDLTGTGYDAQVTSGTLNLFDGVDSANALYLNGNAAVYGDTSTKVAFGSLYVNAQNTVFNLCKYHGPNKQRIISTSVNNALFGFHSGKSGVAYNGPGLNRNGWITDYSSIDQFGDDWVLSSQTPALYRGNTQDLTVTPQSGVSIGVLQINDGAFPAEVSDFACAEVIVFNDQLLAIDEIECIENYLISKYGLAFTRNPTAATMPPTLMPSLSPTLEPTTASPTTPAPTSAAPTTAEPTTAVPTTPAPTTTVAPTMATTLTNGLTLTTTATATATEYRVTIEFRSASCADILVTVADALDASLAQVTVDEEACEDDDDVGEQGSDATTTATLLVAIADDVQLDTDVIQSTLREAMVQEYGEDIVDVGVEEEEEGVEDTQSHAGVTTMNMVAGGLIGAFLCGICGGAFCWYYYTRRMRRHVQQLTVIVAQQQPQPQQPHQEVGIEMVHGAVAETEPGAYHANADVDDEKENEDDVNNADGSAGDEKDENAVVTPGIHQVATFLAGAEENSDSEQLYNSNNNDDKGTRNPTSTNATPAGTSGATVGHDPKLGVYELKRMVDL